MHLTDKECLNYICGIDLDLLILPRDCDFDAELTSMEEVYESYIDCRRRKRKTENEAIYEINELFKLYKLYLELNSGKYKIGKSIAFCVDYPVKREVFAADFRDRIVHHLLVNRIYYMFEKTMIDDSYSCRIGRGTEFGAMRLYEYLKDATENYTVERYVVKCDLKSFFMSIPKDELINQLFSMYDEQYNGNENDLHFIKHLTRLIVSNEPQNNCIRKQPLFCWNNLPRGKSLFDTQPGYGLPIGNLTSQLFANFYLNQFDHFMQSELKSVKRYGRYVDDFFFITNTKAEALRLIPKIRTFLSNIGVILHPKKVYIQKGDKGINFIGAAIKKDRIYVGNRTVGRMVEFIMFSKKYIDCLYKHNHEPSLDDIEYYVSVLNSYIGFMGRRKSFNIKRKWILSEYVKPWLNYCFYEKDLSKMFIFREYKKYSSDKCSTISVQDFKRNKIDMEYNKSIIGKMAA